MVQEDGIAAGGRALAAGRVLLPDGTLGPATVEISGDRIGRVEPGPPRRGAALLPPDAILAPGFVDLQVNGGAGLLVNDVRTADELIRIAEAHRTGGTTSLLPTVITDAPGAFGRIAALVEEARARPAAAAIAGLHVEGPFISPGRPGIHPLPHVRPLGPDEAAELAALGQRGDRLGPVLLTLAPETLEPGRLAALAGRGLVVAAGHTEASAALLREARREGLAGYTHLFNAMPPLAGRAPGPVGACLDDDGAWCGLIADLVHVDPVNLRLAIGRKGAARVALVTDAMPVAGTAETGFLLGGRPIRRANGALRAADGTLAGADLSMEEAVRNVVEAGAATVAEALRMATATPADAVGLVDRGRIAAGCRADLVHLDGALAVVSVMTGGTWRTGRR